MKLLFDANLSPQLVALVSDMFPESVHVFDCGDIASDDRRIWEFAASNGLTIVTKDNDFHALSMVRGRPPKVVHLRVGNGSTSDIERTLRNEQALMADFDNDLDAALLVIDR